MQRRGPFASHPAPALGEEGSPAEIDAMHQHASPLLWAQVAALRSSQQRPPPAAGYVRRIQGPGGCRVVLPSAKEGPYWAPGWEAALPSFDLNEGSGAERRAAAIAQGKAAAVTATTGGGGARGGVGAAGGGDDD